MKIDYSDFIKNEVSIVVGGYIYDFNTIHKYGNDSNNFWNYYHIEIIRRLNTHNHLINDKYLYDRYISEVYYYNRHLSYSIDEILNKYNNVSIDTCKSAHDGEIVRNLALYKAAVKRFENLKVFL